MEFPIWLRMGIDSYGYWAILLAVAIESMGIPFPGETVLVIGAVYAATQHTLAIPLVIAAAAVGAIVGDNLGYAIGRRGGYPVLQRIARLLHLDLSRLSYSERFFARHGDKTVFFGRFFAILRTWVAFLAGLHRMPYRVFFFWNAAGGIAWSVVYGLLGYLLGNNIPLLHRVLRTLGVGGVVLLVAVVLAALGVWWYRRRREARMSEDVRPSEVQEQTSASEKDSKRMSSTSQRAGDLLVGLEVAKQRLHAQRSAKKHLHAAAKPDAEGTESVDVQPSDGAQQSQGTP